MYKVLATCWLCEGKYNNVSIDVWVFFIIKYIKAN